MVRVILETSLYQKIRTNLKNSKSYLFLALMAVGIGVTFFLVTQRQDLRQRASGTVGTEFGFNTHVSAANNNLDINTFKSNVDTLAANGQKWIRFNIIDFEVAAEAPNTIPTATPTPTPSANPGLLRVQTNPAAEATIIVKNPSGQVVHQKSWSVDWISLPVGKYTIQYTYPHNTINGLPVAIPQPQNITVYSNQTTVVVSDLTKGTETITPNPLSGLLRVQTIPAAEATITVADTAGQTVLQKTWSVDWTPLPAGNYTLTYVYPFISVNGQTPKIPTATQISISENKTTTVIADLTAGTSTVQSVQGISSDAILWNNTNLAIYDTAIDYARSKGLKVFLVTNTPAFAKNYTIDDYKSVVNQFYDYLSKRYTGKVEIWQIFNEADTHHFRDYSALTTTSPAYLSDLNSLIAIAKNVIKTNDSNALITANVSGYPMNDATVQKWYQFFDSLKDNLDILSVDMYPTPDLIEIAKLGSRVDDLKTRYSKDVAVAETGTCTLPGTYTEADQENYVTKSVNSLKLSTAKLIILYEIMDESTSSGLCEGTFGILRTDGTKKSSFDAVMASMHSLPTLTPTASTQSPTPTLLPTSTPIPTSIPLNTPSATMTPSPIPTATPTRSPSPTPTPTFIPTLTPTPTSVQILGFKGEYYNNSSLIGVPALIRDDSTINFNWGANSPDPKINSNAFSVRWTKNQSFTSGYYRFTVSNDDGMRVYIDGTAVYNSWKDQGASTRTFTKYMSQGVHTIIVQYYENKGQAVAKFTWSK